MPLERLVLILVIVIVAAGVTVLAGSVAVIAYGVSPWAGIAIGIPAGLFTYLIWRMIANRLGSKADENHDEIGK